MIWHWGWRLAEEKWIYLPIFCPKKMKKQRGIWRPAQHSQPGSEQGGRLFAVSSCLSLGVEKAREHRHYQEDLSNILYTDNWILHFLTSALNVNNYDSSTMHTLFNYIFIKVNSDTNMIQTILDLYFSNIFTIMVVLIR